MWFYYYLFIFCCSIKLSSGFCLIIMAILDNMIFRILLLSNNSWILAPFLMIFMWFHQPRDFSWSAHFICITIREILENVFEYFSLNFSTTHEIYPDVEFHLFLCLSHLIYELMLQESTQSFHLFHYFNGFIDQSKDDSCILILRNVFFIILFAFLIISA